MKNIAILYAESQFTPWNENINLNTVLQVQRAIPATYNVSIVHMTEPNSSLAKLLLQFHWILNLCYGFGRHSQADVAMWLDKNKIQHLSSNGIAQYIAQDKLSAEKKLIENDISVPMSINSPLQLSHDHYISKPRHGGCHRQIEIVPKNEVILHWQRWKIEGKLVQPYLSGREFSVAILPTEDGSDYTTLPPLEILPVPAKQVFIAGSSMGKTKKEFSPKLTSDELCKIQSVAIKSHKILKLEYMSRVDIRLINSTPYVLDVNTMPNLHPTQSMFPALLKVHNIGMSTFIQRLINCHYKKTNELKLNNEFNSMNMIDFIAQ